MHYAQTELNINGLKFPKKEIELTELEKKVFDLIPVGKANAKPNAYIANTLDISSRHVIELVRRLRLKSYDIGSTTNEGYYRFENPQEYQEFMNKYSNETARREKVIAAMRLTPMAQKITVEMNSTAKQKTPTRKDAK